MRVRWTAVAIWTALVASILVGVLAFSIHRAALDAAALAVAPPDPHRAPMDYADPGARRALNDFETFTLGRGLDSLAAECDQSSEIYRVIRSPGLGDGDFTSVELSIAGGTANLEIRRFGTDGVGKDYAWQVVAYRTLDESAANAIQAAAASLLNAGLRVADDHIVDASETTAETCRRGRYHFFVRYRNGDEAFDAFATMMLAHAKRTSTQRAAKPTSGR